MSGASIRTFDQLEDYAAAAAASPSEAYTLSGLDTVALAEDVGASDGPKLVPGIDTLPTGMVYDEVEGTVTVNGDYASATVSNLLLENIQLLIATDITTVTDVHIIDSAPTNFNVNACIVVNSGNTLGEVTNCSWTRTAFGSGISRLLFLDNNAPALCAPDVRDCYCENIRADFVRPEQCGIIERNFVTQRSMDDAAAYDPAITYNTGDAVLNSSGHLFFALQDNVTNPPPTTKISNAEWQNDDPHGDFAQMAKTQHPDRPAGETIIRHNYWAAADNEHQPTVGHVWLEAKQSEASHPLEAITVTGNVFLRHAGSPHSCIKAGSEHNGTIEASTFSNNWITESSVGYGVNPSATPAHRWINNRDADTGVVTAVPPNFSNT